MRVVCISLALLSCAAATAETLKDPYTRDEDISKTELTAKVSRDGAGLYHYVYRLESSIQNKGAIGGFSVDISCGLSFDPIELPNAAGLEGHLGDLSFDGKHVPAAVRAAWGSAHSYLISSNNEASWIMQRGPGGQSDGLEIITPAPPGLRQFLLFPSMDIEGWAYTEDMGEDPNVPWIPDFMVTGLIEGPACGQPTALFLGTQRISETEKINSLLTYGVPLRDRFHTTADELTMTIHYSPDIDPKHFHVEPASYRHYFHVAPGTVETVTLPLDKAKNKIKLQAQARNEPGRARDKAEGESASRNDVDVFEIRVDSGTPKRNAE